MIFLELLGALPPEPPPGLCLGPSRGLTVPLNPQLQGFPGPFTHGGIWWGQSVNWGVTHEGGHTCRPHGGGPNFDRLYHKLKVLLLLSCNYMMQVISYDSIKTRC